MSPEPGPPRRTGSRAGGPHDREAGQDPIDLHPLASTLAEGAARSRASRVDDLEVPAHGFSPAPPPPSLGPVLREARRRRAVTLLDASHATRINPAYLEALEAEHWELLPAPVYVRGFARSYGRFLGLDADLVRSLIPQDLPRPPELEPAAGLRRSPTDHLRLSLPPVRPRPFALAAGAILLGVLAVFGLFRLLPDGSSDSSDGPAVVATSPAGGAGVAGTAAGPPETTPPAAAPSTVTVTTTPATSTPAAQATTPAATATAPAVATVPPFEDGRMPDLRGVLRGEAEQLLDDLRLGFVVIEVATDAAPAGIVFDQAPAPGERASADTSVTLIVSQGPPPG